MQKKSREFIAIICAVALIYLAMGILLATVTSADIVLLLIVFLAGVVGWLAIFFRTGSFLSIGGVTVSFIFIILAILKVFQILEWDEILFAAPLWGVIQGILMIGEGIFEKNRRMFSAQTELVFGILLLVLSALLFILPPAGILTMVEITRILVGLQCVFVGASVLCHLF